MLTKEQQKICDKYSARDEKGKVHCKECPLVIDSNKCICKAFMHYDRRRKEWVCDE